MTAATSEGETVDPIMTSAIAKLGESGQKFADTAAAETGGLLRRLLGPSADVLGEDWANRLRQKNMERLLRKTENLVDGQSDPGWAQPRVAAAVFGAAQYANDEIVTDYLSGVLASSRAPDGGTDDALPWSNLVSRLSALQLRMHYVLYSNLRQVVRATDEITRLYQFKSQRVMIPLLQFAAAVGLGDDESDQHRFADALSGLQQEDLVSSHGYGGRDFFEKQAAESHFQFSFAPKTTKRLETPYDDVLEVSFSRFGVQFFLWGLGLGMAHDTVYLDSDRVLQLEEPDSTMSTQLIEGIDFSDSFWVEYDADGNAVSDEVD